MIGTSFYRRIIAGDGGTWAAPARALLRAAEALYSRAVAIRNSRYDRNGPRTVLPIPVISVGNLTVGGTGKTPFVIELVKRLDRMGLSPAVVSRGYNAADGEPNDEELLIRKRRPSVVCVCDSDRALAGEIAHRKFGADVIVLDDGFQHRRLGRTIDIVLLDATCPFGFDHMLPRGLLREPVESLGRAHVIVLTRCDQASRAELSRIRTRLDAVAGDAIRLQCNHRVTSVERLNHGAVEGSLEGRRAVAFAGVAHPRAFLTTVRSLGVEVVGEHFLPDHYNYRRRDVDFLLRRRRFPPHDMFITTEKDAVKLTALGGLDLSDIFVVNVEIDFIGQDGTILQGVLDNTLHR